jgi:membrane protease YdiL (CAAX protease family)
MLFLLKRTWPGGLAGLTALALLGLLLRHVLGDAPAVAASWRNVLLGVAVVGGVLVSDVSLHGLFLLVFGEPYRRRHRELAGVFRGQGLAAILAGAAMAGFGEELVFRGLSADWRYLLVSAVAFGLLHHVRRSLWPFTVWAVWQGLLFAAALWTFEALSVTMTAHFLHDFAGFLIFRRLNATAKL